MIHFRRTQRMMRQLVEWVGASAQGLIPEQALAWDTNEWNLARFLIARQGVGPYLALRLREVDDGGVIPGDMRNWLEGELENNTCRNRILMDELEAILDHSHRSGIRSMPLKGSYLVAASIHNSAGIRPMADLDLLIRPEDLAGMHATLLALGYERAAGENSYSNHYVYLRPGNRKIYSIDGEHPNNPRPVEIHTALRRPLWGDIKAVDLTESMWQSSRISNLLGHPACVPDRRMLLAHVSTHAMESFSLGKGRLIQLLDVSSILDESVQVIDLPYSEFVYPMLVFSMRVWGKKVPSIDTESLAERVPTQLARWCHVVPIDGRCGLAIDIESRRSKLINHWMRWRPAPWRLALAYGDLPYWSALWAHFRALLRHAVNKAG